MNKDNYRTKEEVDNAPKYYIPIRGHGPSRVDMLPDGTHVIYVDVSNKAPDEVEEYIDKVRKKLGPSRKENEED